MLIMLPFHHNIGKSQESDEDSAKAPVPIPPAGQGQQQQQQQQQQSQDGDYHLQQLLGKMLEANEIENRTTNPTSSLNPTPMQPISTGPLINPDEATIQEDTSSGFAASYPSSNVGHSNQMLNPMVPMNPLHFQQGQSAFMNQLAGPNPSDFFLFQAISQAKRDHAQSLLLQQQQYIQQQQQQQHRLKMLLAQNMATGNLSNLPGNKVPQKIPIRAKDKNTVTLEALGATSIERRKKNEPYFDASKLCDPSPRAVANRRARGGVTEAFPEKLHRLIRECEDNGDGDIISFLPHGRAFLILKPEEFVGKIMPKYFKQSRLSSFQRQLNLYGFTRIVNGPDTGGYYHELFLKGRPALVIYMRRAGIPQIASTQRSIRPQGNTPDFYSMSPVQLQKGEEEQKGQKEEIGEVDSKPAAGTDSSQLTKSPR